MDPFPYHHYFFFALAPEFYRLPEAEQASLKEQFKDTINSADDLLIVPYATLGFKVDTTFMLWARAKHPTHNQDFLNQIIRTPFGSYLTLTYTYFGVVRASQYSGRAGKPEQVIQNFDERLPYLILYPFTKTHEWYQHTFEERRAIMGEHVKVGIDHEKIRQCLLYSYGLDDYEFLVSYETSTLEEFQKLIMEMRSTKGRPYTLTDTPIFTCIYKSLEELTSWL